MPVSFPSASDTSSQGGLSVGGLPRERKQSNPLSQFRSQKQQKAGGRPGRGGLGVNPKGKDRYSDAPDDDDRGPEPIPGLGGRGESDGEFDEGWTGDLHAEDDEITGLLAGEPGRKVRFLEFG